MPLGMRRCRINLPNRCCHLISRVARRAFEFEGLQTANRKDRYNKENYCGNLLWQSSPTPLVHQGDTISEIIDKGGYF